MTPIECREMLLRSVEEFNKWRKENADRIDIRSADLWDANLRDANLRGADLEDANLRGADLRGADLDGANLEGAKLEDANLRGANLMGANLWDANLRGANLEGANLRGADLDGADLEGADLRDVKLSWSSHDMIAEILSRAAGNSVPRRMIAGLILISRDWCWKEFVAIDHPEKEWALRTLAGYAQPYDGHHAVLDQYRENLRTEDE